MHEYELESLLRETLRQHAKAHRDRVADLEYAIIEELPGRRSISKPLLTWQWGLVVASALVLFLGGLWAGSTFRAPCADPKCSALFILERPVSVLPANSRCGSLCQCTAQTAVASGGSVSPMTSSRAGMSMVSS